jgi:VanZ family protein
MKKLLTKTFQIIQYYKITITAMVLIVVASLLDTDSEQLPNIHFFAHMDKVVHFSMYATLTFVFMWENYVRHKYHLLVNRLFMITSIVLLMGIALEFIQAYFTNTRSGSIWDGLANILGFIGGMVFFHLSKKNKRLKEKIFSLSKLTSKLD